ncbi:AMP dependent ligase/synthetase [Entamoeba marina]
MKNIASGVSTSHMNSDDVTDRFFVTDNERIYHKEQFHVTFDGFTQEQQANLSPTSGTFVDALNDFERNNKEMVIFTEEDEQLKFDNLYRNAKIFAKALMCLDVDVKQPGVLIMLENGIHTVTAALGVMLAGMSMIFIHNNASLEMIRLVINKANIRICLLDKTSLQFRDLIDIYDQLTLVSVEGIYKDIYEKYNVHGIVEIRNKRRHKLTQKLTNFHTKEPQFYDEEVYEIETENECVETLDSFLSRSYSVTDEELQQKISSITTNTILEIVFVSSKQGGYKGIIWTHGNVLAQLQPITALFQISSKSHSIQHLPNAYYMERIFTFYLPLIARFQITILPSTSCRDLMLPLIKSLEKTKPTLLFSTPRVFSKLNALEKKKCLKKSVFISTADAISTQNIPLYTGICSPEVCGFVTLNTPNRSMEGTSGPILEGLKTNVNHNKLRVFGPSVTGGYVSGDIRGENGVLLNSLVEMRNVSNLKYYVVLGKRIPTVTTANDVIVHSPIMEDLLRNIQTIVNCLVVGEGRRCVGALLVVDIEMAKSLFGNEPVDVRRNIDYTKWLRKRVEDIMDVFPGYMRVKRFVIIKDAPTEEFPIVIKPHLSMDERVRLYKKFSKAIDMLYPNEFIVEKKDTA